MDDNRVRAWYTLLKYEKVLTEDQVYQRGYLSLKAQTLLLS